jgi:transcription elongation GreA/GreB family factor
MKEKELLEEEIEKLRHELSVVIPQEMQVAVELGDLRENSEFSSIVAKQHFISVRLKQLTDRLRNYRSVDMNSIPRDAVGIGSVIKTRHIEENKIVYFKMVLNEVGDCSDEKYAEITTSSPLGKSLTNKRVKDEVTVNTPQGRATYRILQLTTVHDI